MMERNTQLTNKHFIDWESDVFGFGYGSGERHVMTVLKRFFYSLIDGRGYYYKDMYDVLGAQQFWLLINALGHADIIEYGTSPRAGWLTEKGEYLRDFIEEKSVEQLCDIICSRPDFLGYTLCFRDLCQCEVPCNNPLFASR